MKASAAQFSIDNPSLQKSKLAFDVLLNFYLAPVSTKSFVSQ